MNAQTQSITVDTTITADCEFYPFSTSNTIYGLNISGSVTLNSDTSLIRVVLYDTLFNEYMVYESYPLISDQQSFSFYDECDETCYLNGNSPYSLEVQIINATLNITNITYNPYLVANAESLQQSAKEAIELEKITSINDFIEDNDMLWFADTNAVSSLSYERKKKLFGVKFNTRGLDYYNGGLYFPVGVNLSERDDSNLIEDWDWRNRHGANDTEKGDFYYDQNLDGEGWMTSVKNQMDYDCDGLCYIYAPLAAVEGLANIYMNALNTDSHIDYNLSEQNVLECDNYFGDGPGSKCPTECDCGYDYRTNNHIKSDGVVDQTCYHNIDEPDDCFENGCTNPEYRITVNNWYWITPTSDPDITDIKTKLIEKGPLNAWIGAYYNGGDHYMAIVGYGKIKVGDIYHDSKNGLQTKTVEPDSPFIGHTYWIFKNSWGGWGDKGYMYNIHTNVSPAWVSYYKLPIDDLETTEVEEPLCFDKDKDGYWNWGIQYDPPQECISIDPLEKDSDDSNPRLGPFDEDYYSIPVAPIMEVRDESAKLISNNGFYSFYDGSLEENDQVILTFRIENNGNAQLNLFESNQLVKNITIDEEAVDYQVVNGYPNHEIPMGTFQEFQIQFTLTEPIEETKMATITIDVVEPDMEDYIFHLVFNDCDQPLGATHYINGNVVWNRNDGPYIKFGNVHVNPGATLTIEGDVAFAKDAGLFIEHGDRIRPNGNIEPGGGKVYIDGGNLTSLCGNLWQGVNVWGYRNESQFPDQDGDYAQGLIRLMNGGTISNAKVAIETIKENNGQIITDHSGGIIIITDGAIENCKEGIVFYPYENYHPYNLNHETNLSYFSRARFFNDKNHTAVYQLRMAYVDGIEIKGCSFESNTLPTEFVTPIGISSNSSSFFIGSYKPLPWQGDPIQTTFTNFAKGIDALDESPFGKIMIDSLYFEDNLRGIYISQVDYPVIIQNEFNVRKRFSFFSESEEMIGLYINDPSQGYVVEENKFYSELHSTELETTECAGIHLTNTGGYPNEIYNNTFNDLSVGITAAGTNRDQNGAGLCIKCNDFRDCLSDIYVTHEGGEDYFGIARSQGEDGTGDPTLAAGNTFSKNDDQFDYEKTIQCGEILYMHHQTPFDDPDHLEPEPYLNIILNEDEDADYSKETSCPSNYSGGGIERTAKTNTFNLELAKVTAYEDTLGMLIDGGDTDELTLEVATSIPPEAVEVRQELLNESPYLSDTIMKSAIAKEDVLPNAMVRDVLVANPQSAKSAQVLQKLNERADPMPGYMMNQIMQGQNIYGAKELLEQKLALHKTTKSKALTQLMHSYLADTTNFAGSIDSIVGLLEEDNELTSQYQLTMKYLNMNDSSNAYTSYYKIPTEFDLDDEQEEEYDLFKDLIGLQWQMMSDTLIPDSLIVDDLFDIEQYYNTMPGVYARNILIGLGELEYNEPVYFPDFSKSSPIDLFTWPDENEQENLMKLFPNPAGEYFTVEYNLKDYTGDYNFQILNINGIVMETMTEQKKQNQFVILTQNYPPGIYLVCLEVNGLIVEVDKVTILK